MLDLSTCVSDGYTAYLLYIDPYYSDSTEPITIIYLVKLIVCMHRVLLVLPNSCHTTCNM